MDQPTRKRHGSPKPSPRSLLRFSIDGEEVRYPDHLRWVCVRCANSCRDVPPRNRNILLTASDIEHITRAKRISPQEFSVSTHGRFPYERKMKKVEGRCVFLQGSWCSIYGVRPLICRFYPFSLGRSEEGVLEVRFDSSCSGIGKGPMRGEAFFHNLVELAKRELCQHQDRSDGTS